MIQHTPQKLSDQLVMRTSRRKDSDKKSIIQICVTHFCIIGVVSACHNCSCFPNGSLYVNLLELLQAVAVYQSS